MVFKYERLLFCFEKKKDEKAKSLSESIRRSEILPSYMEREPIEDDNDFIEKFYPKTEE